MIQKDPIQEIEKIVKDTNKNVGKYTQPVLSRYPLLFAFLVTFALAAILDGFKFLMEKIEFFVEHPIVLILIGIIVLIFTGTLYKTLKKGKD